MALFGLATLLFLAGIVAGVVERIRGTAPDWSEMLGGGGMFAALFGIPLAFVFDWITLGGLLSPVVLFFVWVAVSPPDESDDETSTSSNETSVRHEGAVAGRSRSLDDDSSSGNSGSFETVERTERDVADSEPTGGSSAAAGSGSAPASTDTEVFDPAAESEESDDGSETKVFSRTETE